MPQPWEMDWGNTSGPVYGPPPVVKPEAPPSGYRTTNDGNLTYIPGGPADPKLHPQGADKPQHVPVAAANGIQSNIEALREVDAAIAALDKRPQSIGPGTGAFGDTFTQFNDPQGTDTRARVGNIGAVKIHDLSGAAVSPTEAPRFQPFVPTVTDRPEVAKQKLQGFREALQSQVKESLDYYSADNGFIPYRTPQTDAFRQSLTGQNPPPADNTPPVVPGQTEAGFDLKQDPTLTQLSPGQTKAYTAWWNSHPNPTPEQLQSVVKSLGVPGEMPLDQAKAIIAAKQAGRGISTDVQVKPDITDVRGGSNTNAQDTLNATARGVLDVPTFGALDKIVALGDTVTNPGSSYDQNLARQYAISDYDQQNHPYARFAGQLGGGFLVPMGEVSSLGQLALKGGAIGAGYGLGSSRSLSDVPGNVALGGVAGAAIPTIIAAPGAAIRATQTGTRGLVDLVDPVTGELNQPMDSMVPAQRVQEMRDLGMQTITPGMAGGRSARVLEQGLNNLPGSAGVMEDVNSAASGELRRSMQGVAQKFGTSKTLNEGGAELQRGANEYIDRASQVASKLYSRIPISDNAPSSLTNTTAALKGLSDRFSSNPDLAGMMNNPRFTSLLDALQKHGLSWKDLKDFRSMIGDKIGEMRFGENDSTGDFRALYGALSEDMRNTAAAQGPGALKAFERANSFYQQKEGLIDNALTRILGPNAKGSPEKAAAAVQAMTMGGKSTGDLKTLAQIRGATVKSGAWDEIASTLIHLGGQPSKSEGRAFEPGTFVRWYSDMSEQARALLFKPDLRKELDRFVAMNQQLGRVKGMTNTSNTTPTMIGSGLLAAGGVAAFSHPIALLGIVGGGVMNNIMARLWTSPKFVNLMTGYSKAYASGNPAAVRSQVGRLQKLATTNPELRDGIEKVIRLIANDNAPQAGQIAASPDEGPQNQAQPY